MKIPQIYGRPMILFPDKWRYGWPAMIEPIVLGTPRVRGRKQDELFAVKDDNAYRSQHWRVEDWLSFRQMHYAGIVLSPFGYPLRTQIDPWPGKPYAPYGLTRDRVPLLHPDDDPDDPDFDIVNLDIEAFLEGL